MKTKNNPDGKDLFDNSVILITGGTGSWGQELTKQMLERYKPREIRIFSRGEFAQVEMARKFQNSKLKFIIGDVRDLSQLDASMENVDIVFHLAALKHVPVCERNPEEAIKTNIIGTMNVVKAAIENNVKKVINVSSDKAVDPFSFYGITKAAGERVIISANLKTEKTKFVCIRGGNVLGSRGSVVPLFKEQILKANEVTITDEKMTRFIFRLKDAINLIFKATADSLGGETYVMKMPSIRVTDLAEVMVEELGKKDTCIKRIGIRPGEKLYEILVSGYEVTRAKDEKDFYIIYPTIELPWFTGQKIKSDLSEEYNSRKNIFLSKNEIKEMLKQENWLNKTDVNYLSNLSKEDLLDYFKIEGWLK